MASKTLFSFNCFMQLIAKEDFVDCENFSHVEVRFTYQEVAACSYIDPHTLEIDPDEKDPYFLIVYVVCY